MVSNGLRLTPLGIEQMHLQGNGTTDYQIDNAGIQKRSRLFEGRSTGEDPKELLSFLLKD